MPAHPFPNPSSCYATLASPPPHLLFAKTATSNPIDFQSSPSRPPSSHRHVAISKSDDLKFIASSAISRPPFISKDPKV
ncbi:hypothetical protein L2E82_16218 [Cichorium intybus]|uniref:Uncharacterized protein n=1 Tax=Cichorium intybus TaxID=13427 RepID=A0ACB9F689_CICIN|nr:hypothetical protein L2E82_16218 [Cichorium intybus]